MYKTSGNTTNLLDHLKRSHPLLIEPTKSDPTLEGYFPKKSNSTYESNSSRKAELDSALARMNASDIQPFRIVEDKGFREFVQCLDPRYKLPSRPTIQNVHLQKIFDDLEKKLQANLNNIDSCAITTDGWSSKANESYITVTCHFIDSEFKLRSVVLGTSKLANELNHSAENISQSLRECLNKWNILEKVNYVVTDTAASMLKACELLEKKNLPCFAHSINLVVQDALSTEKVKVILTKCKRIVAYFKSSTIAYARLRKE
ncbi:zinc finger BED domain-containing protein 1-like [Rhagoletis pomonella]|uniref:zinc finger BED domain-containing protein 1-like n=1 Tax=Rhagoletis pomonella TaxID=28610 RepID=UPI001786A1A8|nr:zinc finger BED domain-containing protein 1-like [Rhagoletis pomonella]